MSEGVYVSDLYNHSIYRVTDGPRELIAGSGVGGYASGQGTSASFFTPSQLVWTRDQGLGLLYIADLDNHRIRVIDLNNRDALSEAGSGTAGYLNGACSTAKFNSPAGLVLSPAGDLYVIEKSNNNVRKINEQE